MIQKPSAVNIIGWLMMVVVGGHGYSSNRPISPKHAWPLLPLRAPSGGSVCLRAEASEAGTELPRFRTGGFVIPSVWTSRTKRVSFGSSLELRSLIHESDQPPSCRYKKEKWTSLFCRPVLEPFQRWRVLDAFLTCSSSNKLNY